MSTPKERIDVLHVDDEPDLADLAAQFLEQQEERIHVRTETGPGAGLDILNDVDFDCIISDYDMPGQNGIEFLEAVREDYPDLPFILYTGKGTEEVASDAISAGVTEYLQKGGGTDQYTVLANRITNAVVQYRSKNRAAELERVHRVIQNLNRALARAETREEIENRICQIISDAEPYLFAWIGESDSEGQTITTRASAGSDEGYLDTIDIYTDE